MTREIHRPIMPAVARPDALYQDLPEKTLEAQLADLEKKLRELSENNLREQSAMQLQIERMKERIRVQDGTEAALEEDETVEIAAPTVHDSPRFARRKDLAGRGQTTWAIAIEDRKQNAIRLVSSDEKILYSNTDYGDVHIVPCFETQDGYSFGAHECNRGCFCRPTIKIVPNERPMVMHKDRPVN
jgi:hypothetical protein